MLFPRVAGKAFGRRGRTRIYDFTLPKRTGWPLPYSPLKQLYPSAPFPGAARARLLRVINYVLWAVNTHGSAYRLISAGCKLFSSCVVLRDMGILSLKSV